MSTRNIQAAPDNGQLAFGWEQAAQRQALEAAIARHQALYDQGQPEIPDAEFDALVEKLRTMAPSSPLLQSIGELPPSGERAKITHGIPMLSLEKCYDQQGFQRWYERCVADLAKLGRTCSGRLLCMPKIDGLAARLVYNPEGKLSLAATRGDGERGEDILANCLQISAIPQTIPRGNLEVRGEIYMPLSIFREFSEHFANPRNLAAGAVKQKDPKETARYRLAFLAYELFGLPVESEMEKMRLLAELGFITAPCNACTLQDAEESGKQIGQARASYDFEIDGVVFRLDGIADQRELGVTAHHPKGAIAWKFKSEEALTEVLSIEWSVGRTATITPVAILAPVELSGATIRRVSLHNLGQFRRLAVSKGAKALVTRRGEVIPYITAIVEQGGDEFPVPQNCPACGAPTKEDCDTAAGESDAVFLRCSNAEACVSASMAALEHFAKSIDLPGFGPKLIALLWEEGLLRSPADFFSLSKEALMAQPRMGEVLADKLLRRIQSARQMPLPAFLLSLGIGGVGKQLAENLARHFGSLQALRSAALPDLLAVEGIGEELAAGILRDLQSKADLIERLLHEVSIAGIEVNSLAGPLQGKSFLFTGSLQSMGRKEAQALVTSLGATAASSVTRDLSYLVVGSDERVSDKQKKANVLIEQGASLEIIDEAAFLQLVRAP